jgi:hypothetical protein
MSTTTSPGSAQRSDALFIAIEWIARIVVIGIPIQAFLASYGLFEGETGLINAHEMFGMVLVLLVVVEAIIAMLLLQRGRVDRSFVIGAFVGVVLFLVQIALGYGTRENTASTAWHVPLGVLLMGGSVMNVVRIRALREGGETAR